MPLQRQKLQAILYVGITTERCNRATSHMVERHRRVRKPEKYERVKERDREIHAYNRERGRENGYIYIYI